MRAAWVLKPKRPVANGIRLPADRQGDVKANNGPHRKRAFPRHMEGHAKIAESAKKRKMRDKAKVKKPTFYPFVYVGNLKPTITEQRLDDMFRKCGKIVGIKLRCSQGQVAAASNDTGLTAAASRLYASVEYFETKAARVALRLNGTLVDGTRIVVSTAPADLPEVQDFISSRIAPKPKVQSRVQRDLKLRAHPTELITEQPSWD